MTSTRCPSPTFTVDTDSVDMHIASEFVTTTYGVRFELVGFRYFLGSKEIIGLGHTLTKAGTRSKKHGWGIVPKPSVELAEYPAEIREAFEAFLSA